MDCYNLIEGAQYFESANSPALFKLLPHDVRIGCGGYYNFMVAKATSFFMMETLHACNPPQTSLLV